MSDPERAREDKDQTERADSQQHDPEPAGEGGNAAADPEDRRDRQDQPYHGGT